MIPVNVLFLAGPVWLNEVGASTRLNAGWGWPGAGLLWPALGWPTVGSRSPGVRLPVHHRQTVMVSPALQYLLPSEFSDVARLPARNGQRCWLRLTGSRRRLSFSLS